MLRSPSLRALVAVYASMLASCAFAPEFPADAALVTKTPELSAVDARGQPVPLDRLPRRPRLQITLPTQLAGPNLGPWLLNGVCDEALLDDLEKLPLNATHLSRSVALRHRWDGQRLEIEPIAELAAGGTYTLALPRKAAMSLPHPFATQLQVDDSPLAGAAVRATFPPAEAAEVPTNLAFALISFDGVVHGSAAGVWIEDERGLAHPAQSEDVACAAYDSAAVSCIRLRPTSPLQAASRYSLRSGRALSDGHGATVSELHAAFTTQRETLESAPDWQRRPCAVDEQELPIGCVLVTDTWLELQLFQNPSLRVVAQLQGQQFAALPGSDQSPIRVGALAPDHAYTLTVDTVDAALNTEHSSWPLHTAAALPALAISEVNSDPRGPEPEQEFVELWNFSDQAVSLTGLAVSDSATELGTELPAQISLAAGARALLVGDGYDPGDTRDEPPAAGSLLVRIGKSVTRGGLANSGERVYLRTADGHRVSIAPGTPATHQGECLARTPGDPRRPDSSDSWEATPCTPGR